MAKLNTKIVMLEGEQGKDGSMRLQPCECSQENCFTEKQIYKYIFERR